MSLATFGLGDLVPETWLNQVATDINAMDTSSSYTATWTGSSSNPAIGNGTLAASWIQVKKLVYFRIALTMGSTTTYGSGAYRWALPVEAARPDDVCGWGLLLDNGTNRRLCIAYIITAGPTSTVTLFNDTNTGSGIGPTVPFTFTTSDSITIAGVYQIA